MAQEVEALAQRGNPQYGIQVPHFLAKAPLAVVAPVGQMDPKVKPQAQLLEGGVDRVGVWADPPVVGTLLRGEQSISCIIKNKYKLKKY